MKNTVLALLCASVLPIHCALAQTQVGVWSPVAVEAQNTNKFDLEFPGGTPQALIDAIEKASKKPVNAIIPDEFVKFQLPALKLKAVTVPGLFKALELSSARLVKVVTGTYMIGAQTTEQFQQQKTSYGFRAERTEGSEGDAVWYFYYDGVESTRNPDVCRYYQLDSYLNVYEIEDITTAIKTGWQMLKVTNPPELKFHPETKLLIAIGAGEQLRIIDLALEQLKSSAAMQAVIASNSVLSQSGMAGMGNVMKSMKRPSTNSTNTAIDR